MIKLTSTVFKRVFILFFLLFFFHPFTGQETPPYFYYTVTKTDKSLWGICKKHHITVEEIKTLNNKTSNLIKPGDLLKIPTKKSNHNDFTIHVVTKEDKNLWQISRLYQTTVNEIIQFNQKENGNVKIGEVLKIPKNGKYLIHFVSKKDKNLWRICQNYTVSIEAVKNCNKKTDDVIHIGDRLIIPNDHQYIPYTEGDLVVTKIPKSSIQFVQEFSPPASKAYFKIGKSTVEVYNDYWDPYIQMGKDVFYLEENFIYKPFGVFVEKTLCELDQNQYYILSLSNRQKWLVMQTEVCRMEGKKSDTHIYYILNLKTRKKTLWCLHSMSQTMPFGDRNSDGNLDVEIENFTGYKIIKEVPSD